MTQERTPIYCDCHGPERGVVMGYREAGRVVWYDKRHGERHVVTVPLTKPAEVAIQ